VRRIKKKRKIEKEIDTMNQNNTNLDTLKKSGVIMPDNRISQNKINLISGAVTQPFVENVWVTTNGDSETIKRMTDIFTDLFHAGRGTEMLDILRLLYGVLGLQFPQDVEQLSLHPETRQYFLFSFLLDLDDLLQDYLMENSNEK
jgi:hypothetical protein